MAVLVGATIVGSGAGTYFAHVMATAKHFTGHGTPEGGRNTAPGNYDGGGASFSETALTNAGAAPGATVTSSGIAFTFPNVAAGTADMATAFDECAGTTEEMSRSIRGVAEL